MGLADAGGLVRGKSVLQNFMLTDPSKYGHAFFPEVFPSHHDAYVEMAGITSWSFWLILEFCEYYRRTGDRELLEQSLPRIEAFIQGTRDFMGGERAAGKYACHFPGLVPI